MAQAYVLAMYDIRGIQEYIYRTAKVKDIIGASEIVDGIIETSLRNAFSTLKNRGELSDADVDLNWKEDTRPLPFSGLTEKKIQVLFIGGGNAYVAYESRDLCVKINKLMSVDIINRTYSLQLAVSMVDITGEDHYHEDYDRLTKVEMPKVKASMPLSRPLGALPVMDIEIKTGYPALLRPESGKFTKQNDPQNDPDNQKSKDLISTESDLKKMARYESNKNENGRTKVDWEESILDMYTTKKGVDSTLAVVHIDGNNMGLRIRDLLKDKRTYTDAVNTMRRVSFNIWKAYLSVFEKMKELFENRSGEQIPEKENDHFVMKVLTAGDDITYVCNGQIALATVEYFCREIVKYSMIGDFDSPETEENLKKYGFTFCAGIAYFNSHFPFSAAYDVAESCCSNAKSVAKSEEFLSDGKAGNWVDFQICRNIQAKNLPVMRDREYVTSDGTDLLRRPYFVTDGLGDGWKITENDPKSFATLTNNILYFQNQKNIPRTFAKQLRNAYPLGKAETRELMAFLKSRFWSMPDGSIDPYEADEDDGKEAKQIAKWYDALEMMDCFIDLKQIEEGTEDEKVSVEN